MNILPLPKVRQPIKPVSARPISFEDLEENSNILYKIFYKTFCKYLGKQNQVNFEEDVRQEIKVFILMNWQGDYKYLHHKFMFWMTDYRDQIRKSLGINKQELIKSIIVNEQISPMTYVLCKNELDLRLAKAKENKLHQDNWISGYYNQFKIIIPQTEYDILNSRANIEDSSGLAQLVQKGLKMMILVSAQSEMLVTVKRNKVVHIYSYNWHDYEETNKINDFLTQYQENQAFWDFVETGALEAN